MGRALTALAGTVLFACAPQSSTLGDETQRAGLVDAAHPNLVLVLFEDMRPRVAAFGDLPARMPNFDRIVSEGVRFTNTFTTAGVCAPQPCGAERRGLEPLHAYAGRVTGLAVYR